MRHKKLYKIQILMYTNKVHWFIHILSRTASVLKLAELSNYKRDCLNIYYLAIYKKHLQIPVLII